MSDKCPDCDRDFKELSEYPLIKVVTFERVPLSDDIVFPAYGGAHFPDGVRILGGPGTWMGKHDYRVPDDVLAFFEGNPDESRYQADDWTWHRDGPVENGIYYAFESDLREEILGELDPYFVKLKGLEGKVVARAEVLPPFDDAKREDCTAFMFMGNYWDLRFQEAQLGHVDMWTKPRSLAAEKVFVHSLAGQVLVARLHYEGYTHSQAHTDKPTT